MKYFEIIISIISAFLILICSIIQFHHHDTDGDMVIFAHTKQHTCNPSNTLHEHNTRNNIHNCNCSCNDNHSHDENNCSLKISFVKYEKKSLKKIIIVYFTIIDYIYRINDFIISISTNDNTPVPTLTYSPLLSLRAPPTL